MSGEYSTYGRKKNASKSLSKTLKKKETTWKLQAQMVASTQIEQEGVYWIHLAHVRDQWRALIYTLNEFSSFMKVQNFLTS